MSGEAFYIGEEFERVAIDTSAALEDVVITVNGRSIEVSRDGIVSVEGRVPSGSPPRRARSV